MGEAEGGEPELGVDDVLSGEAVGQVEGLEDPADVVEGQADTVEDSADAAEDAAGR